MQQISGSYPSVSQTVVSAGFRRRFNAKAARPKQSNANVAGSPSAVAANISPDKVPAMSFNAPPR
jgi:hypothetical protein